MHIARGYGRPHSSPTRTHLSPVPLAVGHSMLFRNNKLAFVVIILNKKRCFGSSNWQLFFSQVASGPWETGWLFSPFTVSLGKRREKPWKSAASNCAFTANWATKMIVFFSPSLTDLWLMRFVLRLVVEHKLANRWQWIHIISQTWVPQQWSVGNIQINFKYLGCFRGVG